MVLTTILGFLGALPTLWKMYEEVKLLTKEDPGKFISELGLIVSGLQKKGTSIEDKRALARDLRDIIGKL